MKIALISNRKKDVDFICAKKAADFLLSKNIEVYSDSSEISEKITVLPPYECISLCDYVITVGGDGTILHVATSSARKHKPLLGINLGRVGYMAEIEPAEIERLQDLLDGNYKTESRMMLSFKVVRNGKTVHSSDALNDVVISRGHILKMAEISLSEGENHIASYQTDGIIFSTPTGSTAYNLSAGGPITDPNFNCIIATPICAHSLSQSRTIVFRPDSEICVTLHSSNSSGISADGGFGFGLEKDDKIYIKKSENSLTLIKLKEQSFFEKLSQKLN